jgi:hypothetical protein
VVAVVSVPAALQKQSDDKLSSHDSRETHYKDPRSQDISWFESPFWSEFFMSDAPTLGRSDLLAWNDNKSKYMDMAAEAVDRWNCFSKLSGFLRLAEARRIASLQRTGR